MRIFSIFQSFLLITTFSLAQPKTGAEQIESYLPLLINKKVGLVINHTSLVGNTHLLDTLLRLKVNVKKIFAPEHGFRGNADAGAEVNNEIDPQSKLPIISLYGKNKKPTSEQLSDIDILIFDIQDVGVRFYTYISTLHYVMEACAENNKFLLILDRPNPNGMYTDGPILQGELQSFVGMHPIPVVHGLTVGELANMIVGEAWLKTTKKLKFKVITCQNYTHLDKYSLPVAPSPNLPNDLSIALYPSLCLFEGTPISVGRGTPYPFQVIGAPTSVLGSFTFVPKSTMGKASQPLYQDQLCFGLDLRNNQPEYQFSLKYLIDFYHLYPDKEKYFTPFFDKLIGNPNIKNLIKEGKSEENIRKTWELELKEYKKLRKKYLFYTDFE
jgi:uncharacterized protein YbbC (DUF1343 family)